MKDQSIKRSCLLNFILWKWLFWAPKYKHHPYPLFLIFLHATSAHANKRPRIYDPSLVFYPKLEASASTSSSIICDSWARMKSFVGQKSPGRELVPTLLKLEELGLDLLYIYVSSVETFPKPEILKPMLGLMLFAEACSKIIRLRGTEDESREGTQRTSGLEHAKQNLAICFAWCMPAAAAAKSLRSCPALCSPIDGSPPGSPVPGILQARTLEWVAVAFST